MKKLTILYLMLFLFKKQTEPEETNQMTDEQDLLCRFVLDGGGKTVGESVAIRKDILIIKDKKDFLGIPLKHVEEKGKKIVVKGLFDTTKAKQLGEEWRKESFEEINYEEED